jgi:hypothetical protein
MVFRSCGFGNVCGTLSSSSFGYSPHYGSVNLGDGALPLSEWLLCDLRA